MFFDVVPGLPAVEGRLRDGDAAYIQAPPVCVVGDREGDAIGECLFRGRFVVSAVGDILGEVVRIGCNDLAVDLRRKDIGIELSPKVKVVSSSVVAMSLLSNACCVLCDGLGPDCVLCNGTSVAEVAVDGRDRREVPDLAFIGTIEVRCALCFRGDASGAASAGLLCDFAGGVGGALPSSLVYP